MAHAEPLTSDLGRVSHSLGFRAPRSQGLQVSLGHFLELGSIPLMIFRQVAASWCSEMSQSIQFHQGQKTWYQYVYQADNFHLSGLLMGRVQLPGRVCHGPWASLCCHLKAETETYWSCSFLWCPGCKILQAAELVTMALWVTTSSSRIASGDMPVQQYVCPHCIGCAWGL